MIECLCKNITTKDVRTAISRGCNTPKEIHKFYGQEPQCCRCFSTMREMIRQQTNADVTLSP